MIKHTLHNTPIIHTLAARSIRLKFGQRPILSGTHIQCRTGKITGLLGRNGSGKTSLMRIIYGDLPCDSRTVTIDGNTIQRPYTLPDLLRYMPQFNFIPGHLTLERICMDFNLELDHLQTTLPELHPFRRQRISTLSTGQRRLVSIYIISRSRTQFVMLDEPFTLLSPIQIDRIKALLKEEKQNKGILITDHLHQHIRDLSDEVYILEDGRTRLANPA